MVGSADAGSQFGASTISLGDRHRRLGKRHCLAVWAPGAPKRWPLPAAGEILIGRDPSAQVCIDAPTVSRRHARLVVAADGVRLSDLASRNSTRVNGELLSGEKSLVYGDVLLFGDVLAVLEELSTSETGGAEDLPPDGVVLELGERTALVADTIMLHVYTQLRRLAQSHLSVLITGETGTGKELAASAVHAWSKRQKGPFISINCAALPESLAESELFGHDRGAFSGAARDKMGLFERASGGTVFLDEIGDLPLAIQPKLLRVLETQRVMRLGATRERPVDVRVVAATHHDLAAAVQAGRFRQDLFYRLSAAVIQMPPLRARQREALLLARRFLVEACASLGREVPVMAVDAEERLKAHHWPGNVRELKNLMESIAALVDGPVTAAHVADGLTRTPSFAPAPGDEAPDGLSYDLKAAQGQLERRSIEAALEATGGNKTRAAKMLNMPLRTLMWKLKRLGAAGTKKD
jgi:transcriptional regulator with GAF, ATPase, and Fis domain